MTQDREIPLSIGKVVFFSFVTYIFFLSLLILPLSFSHAQSLDTDSASGTPMDLSSYQPVSVVKSDFQILSEQAERISHNELLISKYAQLLDRCRNTSR